MEMLDGTVEDFFLLKRYAMQQSLDFRSFNTDQSSRWACVSRHSPAADRTRRSVSMRCRSWFSLCEVLGSCWSGPGSQCSDRCW